MTEALTITLKAMVDRSEQAVIREAAALMESSLATATGGMVTVSCQFESSLEALWGSGEPCVVITSLLPEVARYQQPWATVADRLSTGYRRLASSDGVDQAPIFICTVFRWVSQPAADAHALLVRIRRLNLLAAELSHETGALVVDIDRRFADIGAARIETDYRLGGPHAARVAAGEIALAVVSAGLDAFVQFEIQDAAKLLITQRELGLEASKIASGDSLPSNVLALGAGRRKQVVATVVDTDVEGHVGWLFHLLLRGRLSPKDAAAKLGRSIASRGVWASSVMLMSAARQILFRRTRVGR